MDKKKLITIILVILTIAGGGFAIYLAVSQQQEAPSDIPVADNNCCSDATWLSTRGGGCGGPGQPTWEQGYFACVNGECNICLTSSQCGNGKCEPGENENTCKSDCGSGGVSCSGTGHCSNGVKDCGETGKDCGGNCKACTTATTTTTTGGGWKCPTPTTQPTTAGSCKDKPPGTVIAYDGGSCTCQRQGDVCACVPTTGVICAEGKIDGSETLCKGLAIGNSCGVGGTCASDGVVSTKQYCFCSSQTDEPPPPPPSCQANSSGAGTCSSTQYCNPEGKCQDRFVNSSSCTTNYQCLSGNCSAGTCQPVGTGDDGGGPTTGDGSQQDNGVACINPTVNPKKASDACNPTCGYNACDGQSGILNCKACTSSVQTLEDGKQLAKEGQYVCMHPTDAAQQTAACGGTVDQPTGTGGGTTIGTTNAESACNSQGSGTWNVYRCLSCSSTYQTEGCQASLLKAGVTYGVASTYMNNTPSCQITQIDCIGTSGGSLIYQSNLNCSGNCDTTPITPGTPPSSGDSSSPQSSGGSSSPQSSGGSSTPPSSSSGSSSTPTSTSTTSAPACVYLNQTIPFDDGSPMPPNTNVTYSAQFTCTSINDNLALAVLDGSTPVGTPVVVEPTTSTINNGVCNYTFEWQATGLEDKTYQVRLLNDGTFNTVISSPTACTESLIIEASAPPPPETACVYLNQTSPTDDGGPMAQGQNVVYTAQYTCAGLDTNIALAVLDGSTPVGNPQVVYPETSNYDDANNTCTYTFEWEASGLAADTYDVRILEDGTVASRLDTPTACTENLSISAQAQEEPVITTVKSATLTDTAAGADFVYTITVTNIGNVATTINTVRDNLPSEIDGTDTSRVINITPTTGLTRTADYIEWAVNQSLAAGASMTFRYTLRFTDAQIAAMTDCVLTNIVTTTYNTDDTYTFEYAVHACLELTGNGILPATGLFDAESRPLLIGLILILIGILANRYNFILGKLGMKTTSNNVVEKAGEGITEKVERATDKLFDTFVGRSEEGFKEGVLRKQERKLRRRNRR